jgi:hypothetical protein
MQSVLPPPGRNLVTPLSLIDITLCKAFCYKPAKKIQMGYWILSGSSSNFESLPFPGPTHDWIPEEKMELVGSPHPIKTGNGNSPTSKRSRRPIAWLWGKLRQNCAILLIVLLVLMGVFLPLISSHHPILHWDSFPITVMFVVVLLAMADKNDDTFMETVLLVGFGVNVHIRIAMVASEMANLATNHLLETMRLCVSMGCLTLIILTLMRHLWTSRISQKDSLLVAAAIYMMIAFNFGQGYALLNEMDPGAFRIEETLLQTHDSEPETRYHFPLFFYYSMVVVTTMGFGDITPLTRIARSLTLVEGLVGQLYMVILMGKIVSLYIEGSKKKGNPSDARGQADLAAPSKIKAA